MRVFRHILVWFSSLSNVRYDTRKRVALVHNIYDDYQDLQVSGCIDGGEYERGQLQPVLPPEDEVAHDGMAQTTI